MVQFTLRKCSTCDSLESAIEALDGVIAQYGKNAWQNQSFLTSKPTPNSKLQQLIYYRDILGNLKWNQAYYCKFDLKTILSRVNAIIGADLKISKKCKPPVYTSTTSTTTTTTSSSSTSSTSSSSTTSTSSSSTTSTSSSSTTSTSTNSTSSTSSTSTTSTSSTSTSSTSSTSTTTTTGAPSFGAVRYGSKASGTIPTSGEIQAGSSASRDVNQPIPLNWGATSSVNVYYWFAIPMIGGGALKTQYVEVPPNEGFMLSDQDLFDAPTIVNVAGQNHYVYITVYATQFTSNDYTFS